MLDPQLIRNELDSIAKAIEKRGASIDINRIKKIEEKRKAIQVKTESLQAERNLISKEIGDLKAKNKDTEDLLKNVALIKDQLEKNEASLTLIQNELNELLITMKKGCLCALCGAIPTPIMNILKYFGDEMKNDMIKEN